MSRPPNREFQEWWNKQRATDHDLLGDKSDGFTRSFLTVDIPTVPSDRESVEKERARSARQLSWVCLLRFQQIASSLAWLSNGFLSLLRTANRRITSPDSLSDSKSSRLYRVIKVFLAVVLLLLVFELVAYFKGWYFSPPTARADLYGMIGLIYAKGLEIRADYLATPLQSLTNMCIVLFLVQSIVRVILILRCCWIKLRGLKPVASLEYPTNAKNDDVNVEDYPMVLVQIPMCNEREANETNEDSNAKKRSKPNESEGTENGNVKVEEESKGDATSNDGGDEKQTKGNSSKPPEPPKDYIHVRARRGQATDSHSLAERVRREKISERMKLLQDLVPGCNKVTGKAHMLDVIINYVQSLQRQVEFLSMKLASVNTRLDFNIDSLISKDMLQSSNSLSHRLFPLDSSAQAFYGQHTQQNPGIHNNILNGVMSHSTVDPLETASPSQNMGMQLPPLNGFNEGGYQANETNEDSNAKKRSKPNESEGTENGNVKVEEESKGDATSNDGGDEKQTKGNSSKPPEPPKDYIHVRARRGQATDSHSLAERVRREKINERMKLLQDLVPGCNKVTGKAHMLDVIINYVQSLQRQVEANETNEDSNAKKRSKPNESEGTENGNVKVEEESKGDATSNDGGDEKQTKGNSSKPPEPPKDYIHVRARRGQATDSHSLAERVRREKINERMKLLQDLVPGCNKVTGKAHMLDVIINYVQSLQRQVEFLSMKLASVNTRLDFNIDNLISKDMLQSTHSLSHRLFPLDSLAQAFYGQHTQQNPGIHNNILNGVMSHSTVDPLETASPSQNMGMQLPPLNGFNEGGYQFPVECCEDDLHTFVQMGFGQSGAGKSHSQNFNGSNQVTHLKVEP